MKINIDGTEIEAKEGDSILEAALRGNLYIPHLCSHPDLESKGGCRLCSVEIEGMQEAVPACITKAEEGMQITVNGPKADRVRKMAMELILATHPADCTGCPKYGKCELQSMYQYMGVGPERWRRKTRTVANDDRNPLINHLFTRCVRCGRCIRACQDLRGVKVLDYVHTKQGIRAGIPEGKSLKAAGCRFCGACVEVCPTGSIVDAVGLIKENKAYAESVVPCRSACPAKVDIPRYIRYIKAGKYEEAVAVIREKIPFPKTLGSICSHACESECKRKDLGAPVSICRLKLAASVNVKEDRWKENRTQCEPTGKKTAVIGGGPAGLTAAYYLAKKGHQVTVFEENEKAGGQCRYGIPAYRLPDHVLDKEIEDILEVGVNLLTSHKILQPKKLREEGYDAVLVTIGTHQGTKLPLEGNNLEGVFVNAQFLKDARNGVKVNIGKRVMVLGGGNVAYDCARTALRMGAEVVHIACLENEQQMTATKEEIEEGAEEGVLLHRAHSFLKITGTTKVEGVELQRIKKFYFDENRKAVIELVEGTNEVIPVDGVIFAVGQKPKGTEVMEVDLAHGPYIKTNQDSLTSLPGIFAAGDVVTGTKSVVAAAEAGRKSAQAIDIYLGGDGDISESLIPYEEPDPYIGQYKDFAYIERTIPVMVSPEERKCSFMEVEKPFDQEAAAGEASRCLQCDLRLNLTKPKLWNEY
jgi:formate dehydrogenase beta subunit